MMAVPAFATNENTEVAQNEKIQLIYEGEVISLAAYTIHASAGESIKFEVFGSGLMQARLYDGGSILEVNETTFVFRSPQQAGLYRVQFNNFNANEKLDIDVYVHPNLSTGETLTVSSD